MKKDAIFRIASQTKAIVSVGIMILQEEGKLLITDPLSKYIPEFKETTVAISSDKGGYEVVKAKREITLRDLLTHTVHFRRKKPHVDPCHFASDPTRWIINPNNCSRKSHKTPCFMG